MKKTITILTLILALILTAGCETSSEVHEPMAAAYTEPDAIPAAPGDTLGEVVDEQTEEPTEETDNSDLLIPQVYITDKRAKVVALEHAGFTADQVSDMAVYLDAEDNEYDVEFYCCEYEYDYAIDYFTGTILSHEKEYVGPRDTTLICKDKAKEIALAHAGLTADEVTELKAEYGKENGVPVYEVEFDKGRQEYSYEIHANTGEILAWEIDD